jgi:1-acyl-sn-glycerol-3-phosphate acyltransferase
MVLKFFAGLYLRSIGWTVHNEVPAGCDKFVIIGAPHTSNWDFPIALALAATMDIKFYFVGKHKLFGRPFGRIIVSV